MIASRGTVALRSAAIAVLAYGGVAYAGTTTTQASGTCCSYGSDCPGEEICCNYDSLGASACMPPGPGAKFNYCRSSCSC
jgi:hypothetical protein